MARRTTISWAMLALGAGIACESAGRSDLTSGTQEDGLDGAIEFFEARLAERPADAIAGVELASRYLMRFGREREIADVWQADSTLCHVLDRLPEFAPAVARRVPVHIARHEFPEALAAARAAYRAAPHRTTNGLLFDAYFEVGQYDSAQAALNRMDPGSFGFLTRKARFAEQLGLLDVARNALTRACYSSTADGAQLGAWCAVRFADLAAAAGDTRQARRHYRDALSERPNDPAAILGLAQLAFQENDLDRAQRLFARAATIPGGADGDRMVSRLATFRGDVVAAERASRRFERAASDPRYGRGYWSALAEHRALGGDTETALQLARQDAAQRPGPEAYFTLGMVSFHAGLLADARTAIDSATTWGPPTAEMQYYSGLISVARGERETGAAMLRDALTAGLPADYAAVARRRLRQVQ